MKELNSFSPRQGHPVVLYKRLMANILGFVRYHGLRHRHEVPSSVTMRTVTDNKQITENTCILVILYYYTILYSRVAVSSTIVSPWADFSLSHPTGFMRNIYNWIWNECGIMARAVGVLSALFCHSVGELTLSGEVARPICHSFPQSPENEDATSELIRRWSILNFL